MGRVKYFVKAVPKGASEPLLHALGLPLQAQRFAIVEAYTAENVQEGLHGLYDGSAEVEQNAPWMKAVSNALVKAGLVERPSDFDDVLQRVDAWAMLLAIGHKSKVTLRSSSKTQGGALTQLAIPVSSLHPQWYHRPAAGCWGVIPLVRIDPTGALVQSSKVEAGAMQRAVSRAKGRLLCFVHTYSRSGSVLYL